MTTADLALSSPLSSESSLPASNSIVMRDDDGDADAMFGDETDRYLRGDDDERDYHRHRDLVVVDDDDDDDGPASSNTIRSSRLLVADESTRGALDALATLACAGGGGFPPSSSTTAAAAAETTNVAITPHQTSSDDAWDDDRTGSMMMPPPPPRVLASAATAASSAAPSCASSSSSSSHGFSFLHDYYPTYPASSHSGGGRIRSASNPEGMEKWDLYSHRNDRQHFVLPISILEEELASTRRVLGEVDDEYRDYLSGGGGGGGNGASSGRGGGLRRSRRGTTVTRLFGTSPDCVSSELVVDDHDRDDDDTSSAARSTDHSKFSNRATNGANSKSRKKSATSSTRGIYMALPPNDDDDDGEEEDGGGDLEDEEDEAELEPEELLRRARSRLLEDLSEGPGGPNGDGRGGGGSVLLLPHSLGKYKEVYNKNGRIGIYTPAERAAIIQKFNAKRARRVWNKKIRYNCRKNLADRRMRVKGRFVKRSVETSRTGSPPTTGSPLCTVDERDEEEDDTQGQEPMDENMPDVKNEEAGFEPSDDMPYRRTRRYTIT